MYRTEKEKRQKERKVEKEKKKLNGVQWIEKEERQKKKKKKKKNKINPKEKRRVIGGREKESDLTRLVGPSHVCLFMKMPWKLRFDNLKTPKMCFQFP